MGRTPSKIWGVKVGQKSHLLVFGQQQEEKGKTKNEMEWWHSFLQHKMIHTMVDRMEWGRLQEAYARSQRATVQ